MDKNNKEDFVQEQEVDEVNAETVVDDAVEVLDEREQQIIDLNEELVEAQGRITQLTSMLQQLQADFDNYRKRNATVAIQSQQKGVFEAIKAILPAFDAVQSAKQQITDASTLQGLDMVDRKLLDSLSTLGIERIASTGEAFDPNLHNAVVAEEVEGVESGTIIEEYSAGYKTKDEVVRFATVKIAK